MAYLRRAKADNVVHTEIFFDPQTHTQRGVPLKCVIEGIHQAQEEGQRTLGITSCLILSFLRDLGPEAAMQTLNEVTSILMQLCSMLVPCKRQMEAHCPVYTVVPHDILRASKAGSLCRGLCEVGNLCKYI